MGFIEQINWQICLSIYVLVFAFYPLIQRKFMMMKGVDAIAVAGIFQIIVGFVHLILAAINGFSKVPVADIILPALVAGVAFTFGNFAVFYGYKSVAASEGSVIFASNSLWVAIIAAVVKGDRLSMTQIIGLLFIVAGVTIISWQKSADKKLKLHKGHLLLLGAAFLFASGFTIGTEVVDKTDVLTGGTIMFFIPGFTTFLFQPNKIKNVPALFTGPRLKFMALIVFIYSIAAIAITYAYANGGLASQVLPISQANILVTVILSYFLLKERDHLIKKFIASLIVILGVILLA